MPISREVIDLGLLLFWSGAAMPESVRDSLLRISTVLWVVTISALLAVLPATRAHAQAQNVSIDDLVSAVVQIKTFIDPEGRTVENLGRNREGSGIVIDTNGLVLTIGYLMVEAHSAEIVTNDGTTIPADVVGYDHDTGFGLLRATVPPKVRPMPLGKSSEAARGERGLVAGFGGTHMVLPVHMVSKREFAGYWEYLLDEAIFTTPPHPRWSGAALISREGKLLGIGSLIVGDATGNGDGIPGNMFVPIDGLQPVLGDLLSDGRVSGPARPWIGITTDDIGGRLVVRRATPGGPAERAGLRNGDVIRGIGGETTRDLADLYRKLWARGPAGTVIPLDITQDGAARRLDVTSVSRRAHLRLKSTF
jgi:S1-C subfamily serine protease